MNTTKDQRGGFVAAYRPMRRRQLLITLVVLILLFSIIGIILLIWIYVHVSHLGREALTDMPPAAESGPLAFVLVPGAPVNVDGTPGLMLEQRLAAALSLFQAGLVSRFLLSGDAATAGYDEITPMRRYLTEHGVSAELMVTDPAGYDTYETLYRARAVYGIREAYVTSQPFHLVRIMYIGNQLNLKLSGVPCTMPPNASLFAFRLREVVARVKAYVDCEILHYRPASL
jgi:SanA protein